MKTVLSICCILWSIWKPTGNSSEQLDEGYQNFTKCQQSLDVYVRGPENYFTRLEKTAVQSIP